MTKMHFISFGLVLTIMALLDLVWLSVMAEKFYKPLLDHLMGPKVLMLPAVLFYLLFAAALTYFVVWPGLFEEQGLLTIAFAGALLGLTAYGTYDLTAHATLKDWPAIVTVVDMAWGAFVSMVVALLSVSATRYLID